jgi:hypothetical protein
MSQVAPAPHSCELFLHLYFCDFRIFYPQAIHLYAAECARSK